jgi:hypothetical protein
MAWSSEWWIVVLVFGIGLLIGARSYAIRARRRGLKGASLTMGLGASLRAVPFSRQERKQINLISRGNSRKWSNILADREAEPKQLLFDFSYLFGLPLIAGIRYRQSVAAFSVRLSGIPDFQMTPATTLDRAAGKLGLQAIRFESHPDFGRKYWLRTGDETAVRAFFTGPFLDRLATADPAANWSVEKAGRWLVVYRHNVLFPPAAILQFWQNAGALASLFLEPH